MNPQVGTSNLNTQHENHNAFSLTAMTKNFMTNIASLNNIGKSSLNLDESENHEQVAEESHADMHNASNLQLVPSQSLEHSTEIKKTEGPSKLRLTTEQPSIDLSGLQLKTDNNADTLVTSSFTKSALPISRNRLKDLHSIIDLPKKQLVPEENEKINLMKNFLFFLKFAFSTILLALIALYTTYSYLYPAISYTLCSISDGIATGFALITIINHLISTDKDIMSKYDGLWKMHAFCVFQITAITVVCNFALSKFPNPNPIWFTLIKAILVLWTMVLYSIYLKNRRKTAKKQQEIGKVNKKSASFFNVKVYKNFMEDVGKLRTEIVKRTDKRRENLDSNQNVFLGREKPTNDEEKLEERRLQKEIVKGQHNIIKMITFRSGILFSIIITLPILQFAACVGLYEVFLLLWTHWLPGSFLVAASYPIVVWIFKLIMRYLDRKYELGMPEFIEFASIVFAALPYRFFYFSVSIYWHALVLIGSKMGFKLVVYLIYGTNLTFWRKLLYGRRRARCLKRKESSPINRLKKANEKQKSPTVKNTANRDENVNFSTWSHDQSSPKKKSGDLNESSAGQTFSEGNQRMRTKKRFSKALGKSIFERMKELEEKTKRSDDSEYRQLYLNFYLLQIIDIIDLIAVLVSMIGMKVIQKDHFFSRLSWSQTATIIGWNGVELAADLILLVLVTLIWRKTEAFRKIGNEIRPLKSLRVNFAVSLGLQAIAFFLLYYIVSNLFSTTNLDISDVF